MCKWKTIKDFPDYEISDEGQVYSHKSEKLLSICKGSQGYLIVGLCKENRQIMKRVHRLVAEAFIPNPDNLPQVNHKDEDKTNNSVNNLEWCTSSYNNNYGTRNKRAAENISKPIAAITKSGELVATYNSLTEAAKAVGRSVGAIGNCLTGRSKTCAGYIWKYA